MTCDPLFIFVSKRSAHFSSISNVDPGQTPRFATADLVCTVCLCPFMGH